MLRLAERRRVVERRGLMCGYEGAHCVKLAEIGMDAGAEERGPDQPHRYRNGDSEVARRAR